MSGNQIFHLLADSLGVYVPYDPLDKERKGLNGVGVNKNGIWLSQALIVTHGPFKGRICLNDDDDYMLKEDAKAFEVRWMEKAGVVWDEFESDCDDEDELPEKMYGVKCEVVTFGYYMSSTGIYSIPQQFLRPATMKDLVQRYQQISEETMAISPRLNLGKSVSFRKLYELLNEQLYIADEIRHRDGALTKVTSKKNIFLCHASDDKPFVRTVGADLVRHGHSVWIDEFEIRVGDSIVDKINSATSEADALILFISESSMDSDWVKREWNSALARSLSGQEISVLPVLIEDAHIPAIMTDIKYADFRKSYSSGLDSLLIALNNNLSNKTERKGA